MWHWKHFSCTDVKIGARKNTKNNWVDHPILKYVLHDLLMFTDTTLQPFCFPSIFVHFSPFEHVSIMKKRVEDQEPVFAPQQQQSHHPSVQGIADNFQPRALAPAPTVIEAAAENMQPSTGIQFSLPHGYQVWMTRWWILERLLTITKFQWNVSFCNA